MRNLIAIILLVSLAGCASSRSADDLQPAVDKKASAKIHTELGAVYYGQLQYGIALEELRYAISMDSSYAPAYGVRGLVHMALSEDEKAASDFERSLDLDPRDSGTRNNYGWFLCQRGREKESRIQFMEAIKNPLYDTPEKAYLNAGLCARKYGNLKDAETFLKNALNMQPKMTEALQGMVELSFAKADYAGAKSYLLRLSRNGAELSASDLFLAARVEQKLGDKKAEAVYKMQLRKRYPESRETQLMLSGER